LLIGFNQNLIQHQKSLLSVVDNQLISTLTNHEIESIDLTFQENDINISLKWKISCFYIRENVLAHPEIDYELNS
jgi:hypothetical protein